MTVSKLKARAIWKCCWPPLQGHGSLIVQMVRREVVGRYRGSLLGIFWSLLTPLFMLAVYTFVFGAVFKARWAGAGAETPPGEFAIILFAGLLVFQLFAEVVTRAPSLILANANYVKKVVFPLEILPPVALGSALCHAGVSLVVLFGFMLAVYGSIPLAALWLPAILAPYCLLILGLAWFLASLGVYYRDVNQFLGTVVTALMFLSPIFFPLSALPEWLRPWVALNPIAFPVEATRAILIFGEMPDAAVLAIYTFIGLLAASLGYVWFQKTRRGFADVL
jgi:lipopolysaccharide transport system permease protein